MCCETRKTERWLTCQSWSRSQEFGAGAFVSVAVLGEQGHSDHGGAGFDTGPRDAETDTGTSAGNDDDLAGK